MKPYNNHSLEELWDIFTDAWARVDSDSENACDEAGVKAVAEACTPSCTQIPIDNETLWIASQPCFAIIGIAEGLRKLGVEIKRKSEDEQAHVMIWALNLYLKHGPEHWRAEAVKLMKSEPLQTGGDNE